MLRAAWQCPAVLQCCLIPLLKDWMSQNPSILCQVTEQPWYGYLYFYLAATLPAHALIVQAGVGICLVYASAAAFNYMLDCDRAALSPDSDCLPARLSVCWCTVSVCAALQ